jgi:hypothetical protein
MEEGFADLIVVSGSNLGRLHPDFPMEPSTDRFERKLRSNLFAPVRSGVLGNEGLTTLNVELAWLGSIPRIALRLATNLFHRDIKDVDGEIRR